MQKLYTALGGVGQYVPCWIAHFPIALRAGSVDGISAELAGIVERVIRIAMNWNGSVCPISTSNEGVGLRLTW
ncbi:MAG: hypothetical protein WA782_07605 [Sulfitobacter sp.]